MRSEILSYSRARGVFVGVSLEGSIIRPDNDANRGIPRMLSGQRESAYLVEDADLQLTGTSRFSIQASRSHCLYRTHF